MWLLLLMGFGGGVGRRRDGWKGNGEGVTYRIPQLRTKAGRVIDT